mmetsp:Transcript_40259/g.113848  ORF Transcript_40259/g.113848 Transcript_40259/m.113848 type:complete len:277 (-) Transcript_40259:184-1014(-)
MLFACSRSFFAWALIMLFARAASPFWARTRCVSARKWSARSREGVHGVWIRCDLSLRSELKSRSGSTRDSDMTSACVQTGQSSPLNSLRMSHLTAVRSETRSPSRARAASRTCSSMMWRLTAWSRVCIGQLGCTLKRRQATWTHQSPLGRRFRPTPENFVLALLSMQARTPPSLLPCCLGTAPILFSSSPISTSTVRSIAARNGFHNSVGMKNMAANAALAASHWESPPACPRGAGAPPPLAWAPDSDSTSNACTTRRNSSAEPPLSGWVVSARRL